MNIIFMTKKSPYFGTEYGGAESSMRLLAAKLAGLGHNVYYIARNRNNYWFIKIKSVLIENVRVYTIGIFERFENYSPIYYLQEKLAAYFISRLIKKTATELVYCYYEINILQLLLNLKERGFNFRIVMRLAGLHWYEACRQDPALIKFYENIFNQVDAVNYISSGLQKMTEEKMASLEMEVSFKRTFVGDIGTSAPIGRITPYSAAKNGDFNLMMASRFSKHQKRQDILIKAAAKISCSVPFKLVLIGSGPRENDIRAFIENHKLADRVTIEPFIDQQELWKRMQRADLLCHACDYEGLGKIIVESMAMGLPVLASNVLPLNDYIIDAKNGFLVDNDPVLWAEKIIDLFYNRKQLEEVSKNSIRYIENNYNPDDNVRLYEKIFSEITG